KTYPVNWYKIGAAALEKFEWPGSAVLALHWPNVLHEDVDKNDAIVDVWIDRLREFGGRFDRCLPSTAAAFYTQLLHHVFTDVTVTEGQVIVDTRGAAVQPWAGTMRDAIELSVAGGELWQGGRPLASTPVRGGLRYRVQLPNDAHVLTLEHRPAR
ncbi:MAG: hypothetical protein AAGK78_04245, partial [Planctomycetota bacterium]